MSLLVTALLVVGALASLSVWLLLRACKAQPRSPVTRAGARIHACGGSRGHSAGARPGAEEAWCEDGRWTGARRYHHHRVGHGRTGDGRPAREACQAEGARPRAARCLRWFDALVRGA